MEILTLENFLALLSLTSLEIILGFDNIVVLTLIISKLEKSKQNSARKIGMSLAMCMRILLLFSISWLMMLTKPIFNLMSHDFSGRDLVLLSGGLFLIAKTTSEIHESVETKKEKRIKHKTKYFSVILQIVLVDIIFSLDSVITAVGVSNHLGVMIIAIVTSVVIMARFAKFIGEFIEEHPTFKILALSFLVLVGVMLFAEGIGHHIDKGYIYFAMSFSLIVEFINLKLKSSDE